MGFSAYLLADHSRRIPFDPYGFPYIRAAAALRCCRTALGRCICGSAARIGNRCFTRLASCSRLLSRSWRCFFSERICAGSVRSVSRQSWRQSEGSNRMRYSLHGCPCGTQSTCCSLTGHIFFAEQLLQLSVHLACRLCKNEWPTEFGAVFPPDPRKILFLLPSIVLKQHDRKGKEP